MEAGESQAESVRPAPVALTTKPGDRGALPDSFVGQEDDLLDKSVDTSSPANQRSNQFYRFSHHPELFPTGGSGRRGEELMLL